MKPETLCIGMCIYIKLNCALCSDMFLSFLAVLKSLRNLLEDPSEVVRMKATEALIVASGMCIACMSSGSCAIHVR